jgi:hypothetical protein
MKREFTVGIFMKNFRGDIMKKQFAVIALMKNICHFRSHEEKFVSGHVHKEKLTVFLFLKIFSRAKFMGKNSRTFDRGSRVRFPEGAGNFSLHHRVRNGSEAHPASYTIDSGALSLGVKRPGSEADHSSPSSAEVKECMELYLHSPIRLHGVVLS